MPPKLDGDDAAAAGGARALDGDFRISPEDFQRMLIVAVDTGRAALGAEVAAAGGAAVPAPTPPPQATQSRKIPDFWEARPAAWFRIFERKTQVEDSATRFDYLLAYLSVNALSQIDDIVDAPPPDPYAAAKKALLSHFQRDKLDKANDLRFIVDLGDRTPSELLRYMRSCQPGEAETSLFTVIFLNALPRNAKDAALKCDTLDEMAAVADRLLSVPDNKPPAVQAISAAASLDDVMAVHSAASTRPGSSSSVAQGVSPLDPTLCTTHARFGTAAYTCAAPSVCRMKNVLRKKKKASASENSKAGR